MSICLRSLPRFMRVAWASKTSTRTPVPVTTLTRTKQDGRRRVDVFVFDPGRKVVALAPVVDRLDDLPELVAPVVGRGVEGLVGVLVEPQALARVDVVVFRLLLDHDGLAQLPDVVGVGVAERPEVLVLGERIAPKARVDRREHVLLADVLPLEMRDHTVEAALVLGRPCRCPRSGSVRRAARDAAHAAQVGDVHPHVGLARLGARTCRAPCSGSRDSRMPR